MLLGLLAAATAGSSWAALVRGARRGLLAVHEKGGDLSKLAAIRDPGPDPRAVVAALVDRIELIVLDTRTEIAPARARTIAGRVRTKKAVLVVAGQDWPHADLRVRSALADIHGLGYGYGRRRSLDVEVESLDRAGCTRSVVVLLDDTGAGTRPGFRARPGASGRLAEVGVSQAGSALRHLPHPHPVLVAPWRAWVAPQPGPGRAPSGRSPVTGQSFELRRGSDWIPGYLFTWARLHVTPGHPIWFGQVAFDLLTGDGPLGHTFQVRVPADAIRPDHLRGPS